MNYVMLSMGIESETRRSYQISYAAVFTSCFSHAVFIQLKYAFVHPLLLYGRLLLITF